MKKTWKIKSTDKQNVSLLAKSLGVSKIVAELLVLRGITSFEEAKDFFRPQLSDLHDPYLMKNMQNAVTRLQNAIAKKEKVLIYGDYDVDGTTSVAMMYSFLKKYTKAIEFYIPCRYEEGYGISIQGINYALEKKCNLIIALDCGIRAVSQVAYANEKGIDFIICDHHTPAEEIPSAVAILNPKQFDCTYPFKELSGCGVGFKLIQAYCLNNNIHQEEITSLLDLVVVSIAADIVPMIGENRILAFYGLKQINSNPRIGLRALIKASTKTKNLTISDVIFGIAPRINSAGRIDHAKKAVEILIEEDYEKSKLFAYEIENKNTTRKNLDKSTTLEALEMVDERKKSTVVFSKKWHKGVVGIVASRLIEKHYKPTIVFSENDGILTGSARSVHDFDLYKAISKCSNLCEKFGGHKYAAGLSVKRENLNKFIHAFEVAVSETITADQLSPKLEIDIEIDINEVNNKLFRIIKQFAPFGPQNLAPVFVSKDIIDNGFGKQIGEDKSHLQINAKTYTGSISCIGFGFGKFFKNIKGCQPFNMCYSINENEWNGRKNLQLIIKDLKLNV
tara:strand:- start:3293 stop:4981 length:1689 start_codon:yes stop_codon:yes gene_type:complete